MDAIGTDVERMIAVLHDVLEDMPVTVDELLERGCPLEVVEAVEVLTKRSGENGHDAFLKADSGQRERASCPRQTG
jgi:(p)ppGpp synthase/HD superfamily hydrolase